MGAAIGASWRGSGLSHPLRTVGGVTTQIVELNEGRRRLVHTDDPDVFLEQLRRGAEAGEEVTGSAVFADAWFGSESIEEGQLRLAPWAVRPDTGSGDRCRSAAEVLAEVEATDGGAWAALEVIAERHHLILRARGVEVVDFVFTAPGGVDDDAA